MSAPAPSLDPLPCAVLQTDGDGRVRYGNVALRGLVGDALFSRAELHLDELLPPASRIFLQTHVWPLLRRQGRWKRSSCSCAVPTDWHGRCC